MYFKWGKLLEPVESQNGDSKAQSVNWTSNAEVVYAQIRLSVISDQVP